MNTLHPSKSNALAWAASLIFLMASGLLWSQDATDPEAQQTVSVTDELDQLEERFYAIRQAEEENIQDVKNKESHEEFSE